MATPDKYEVLALYQGLSSEAKLMLDYREILSRTLWHSQERIDLLERVGNDFAVLTCKAWLDALVLCLQRALDPIKGSGRQNLSLAGFVARVSFRMKSAEVNQFHLWKAGIDQKFANIERWRNRVIAHLDESTALGKEEVLYSWGQLDELVTETASRIDVLAKYVFDGPTTVTQARIGPQIERFIECLNVGLSRTKAASLNNSASEVSEPIAKSTS